MSPISTGAAMVLSILLIIVSLVATFLEYYAHSVVMEDMDYHLSMSWKGLWKWHFSMYATMIGAIILAGIVPLLSVLAVLAASIGLVVVGIFGAIFLFESSVSARRFADYHVEV